PARNQACADCVNLSAMPAIHVSNHEPDQTRGWPGLGASRRPGHKVSVTHFDGWCKVGDLRPISLGGSSRIEEFAEHRHLGVADGEDMDPIACHLPPSLADRHGVLAKHEHLLIDGIELARRKVGEIEVGTHCLEEFVALALPSTRAEGGKIRLSADTVPIDL